MTAPGRHPAHREGRAEKPAGVVWPSSGSQRRPGKGALSQLGPRPVLPVTAAFLTKQPLSTPPKMHCPCPQRRQMSASLRQRFQPCLLQALERGTLSSGQQHTATSLSRFLHRKHPPSPALASEWRPHPSPAWGGPQLYGPRGATYQGRGAWEGTQHPRQSHKEKQDVPSPLPCCPHSQDSTLFLIFSLILVQELGEAGENSSSFFLYYFFSFFGKQVLFSGQMFLFSLVLQGFAIELSG